MLVTAAKQSRPSVGACLKYGWCTLCLSKNRKNALAFSQSEVDLYHKDEEINMTKVQSVEPNIADLANGWLKSYKLHYKLEQESLNTEIDQVDL